MSYTTEQIKNIPFQAVADNNACHVSYVGYLVNGKRRSNSVLAKAILSDIDEILEFLEQQRIRNAQLRSENHQ